MKILFKCYCGYGEFEYSVETLKKNITGTIQCSACGDVYKASEVLDKVNKLNVADFKN